MLALATYTRFYFVSWLGERTVADFTASLQERFGAARGQVLDDLLDRTRL